MKASSWRAQAQVVLRQAGAEWEGVAGGGEGSWPRKQNEKYSPEGGSQTHWGQERHAEKWPLGWACTVVGFSGLTARGAEEAELSVWKKEHMKHV